MMYSSELEAIELTEDRFPRSIAVLKEGVVSGVSPGFVAGIWQKSNPDQIKLAAAGSRRVIPSIQPMGVDTDFDLASLTKIMATAALTAVLVERGWLSWNTPITSILQNYSYPNIEVRHLLSHTAGFVAWEPYWQKVRDRLGPDPLYTHSVQSRQNAMRSVIFSIQPQAKPGEQAVYSDVSFLLLGFLLEDLLQMPLDRAVKRFVWQPMGLRECYFHRITRAVSDEINDAVAATEDCPWRGGVIQGQVHDDNCWAMGGYAGHSGVFGSVREVLHFSRALMTGFFTPQTLKTMWTKASEPEGCTRTLGWDTPSGNPSSSGTLFSPRSVGHLGFTGTSLWIDPEAELAVALLSNRVHPSRENNQIRIFRPQFHDAIRQDLRL